MGKRVGLLAAASAGANKSKEDNTGPALTTRGVRAAQASKAQARSAVRTVIDKWLDEHSDSWADVWASISTGFFDSEVQGIGGRDGDTGSWDASVATFDHVSKQRLAQIMSKVCGVSLPLLDLIDAADGRGLKKLFVTWTGIPLKMSVDGHLRDKQVMSRFIEIRWEELGKRSAGFKDFVTSSGVVDWAKVAPWQFTWNEGKVTALRHNLAGEVVLRTPMCVGVCGWEGALWITRVARECSSFFSVGKVHKLRMIVIAWGWCFIDAVGHLKSVLLVPCMGSEEFMSL